MTAAAARLVLAASSANGFFGWTGNVAKPARVSAIRAITGQKIPSAKCGSNALWAAIFADLKTEPACLSRMEESALGEIARIAKGPL